LNGEHVDLEMHLSLKALDYDSTDDRIDAVVIVWFSVEDYDRNIQQKDN